jgi:hypothetical protein
MTEPIELDVTPAYTRQAVDEYLRDVTAQRTELEAAIAHARARTASALDRERRIAVLERRVGERIVGAHVRAAGQSEPVFTDPPMSPPGAGREHGRA